MPRSMIVSSRAPTTNKASWRSIKQQTQCLISNIKTLSILLRNDPSLLRNGKSVLDKSLLPPSDCVSSVLRTKPRYPVLAYIVWVSPVASRAVK